jgi:carbamoyl-phosphate synthase small subunit
MKYTTRQSVLLSDGTIFHGKSIGISGTTFGEFVLIQDDGYQEILLILLILDNYGCTNPHIGNYGVNDKDVESDSIKISGFVKISV